MTKSKAGLPPDSLREYLRRLDRAQQLAVVRTDVDPYLEIAEITRRVVRNNGPAILFTNVRGSSFPVATNLYGSEERAKIAFGADIEERMQDIVSLASGEMPPSLKALWKKRSTFSPLIKTLLHPQKITSDFSSTHKLTPDGLASLPITTSWKEDGGPFVTLPLVFTESLKKPHSKNLGMYRLQKFDNWTTGLHWQIGKGGGFHFHEAEELGQNLPVSIFLGGPPALTLAAITPLPENVPELLFTSFLLKRPLKMTKLAGTPHLIPSDADFIFLGKAPCGLRRTEGPFGDHFGYVSLEHDFPLFQCNAVYHRQDAIYPATVVGPPPQEDLAIGEFLESTLKPLFPLLIPSLIDLHTYGESGFHALCSIKMRERYEKEALTTACRVLGEGQLALTKIALVTDEIACDLNDFAALFEHILARIRPDEDIIILSHTANDTLDYTGPRLNRGSKAIFMGLGRTPRRKLETTISSLPEMIEEAALYCPGCLVVHITPGTSPEMVAKDARLAAWTCVIIVDEPPQRVISSQMSFLWTVFTRFEPANDLFFHSSSIRRLGLSHTFPMVIDARMKPSYPPQLIVDSETEALVTKRWTEYFSP